jgi:hypothetical protein
MRRPSGTPRTPQRQGIQEQEFHNSMSRSRDSYVNISRGLNKCFFSRKVANIGLLCCEYNYKKCSGSTPLVQALSQIMAFYALSIKRMDTKKIKSENVNVMLSKEEYVPKFAIMLRRLYACVSARAVFITPRPRSRATSQRGSGSRLCSRSSFRKQLPLILRL